MLAVIEILSNGFIKDVVTYSHSFLVVCRRINLIKNNCLPDLPDFVYRLCLLCWKGSEFVMAGVQLGTSTGTKHTSNHQRVGTTILDNTFLIIRRNKKETFPYNHVYIH